MKQAQNHQDIDDRTEALRDLVNSHPGVWKDFLADFELSWIYHENAIEGIVVTHAEMTSALRGKPISVDTYHAIRNEKRAIGQIKKLAGERMGPIDLELILSVHSTLSEGSREGDDPYRKIIPLHRTYFHDIAQPQSISSKLARLVEWARANDPDEEDSVRFAAQFHHEFMSVFPFPVHSGKTGRLLLNYVLMRHGYMPVLFHATERQRYFDTFRFSAKEMERLLVEMMNNCIDNAESYIKRAIAEREKTAARRLRAV
ncbi:MAG: Fic family protein [Deltaproteobacteria bacterium]|nr:Fic family protein [Deltaproteobacteria bacterium]